MQKGDVRLLLDNIRSVHNAGSIFRTAETIGIGRIYCAGTTPIPIDRFGRRRRDFAKVALGAEHLISWQQVNTPLALIRELKSQGYVIIALEQTKGAVDYRTIHVSDKALIILGNEVVGVSRQILKLCDVIAEIPLRGQKESLNVSVAAGIFLFGAL
ncbi:MAG: TrmH family RNA methyltransferase [Patescibacteria group bacterium]|nr:TrmH family RNA methyltransferase [Patescibacteria group bacterium]MDE2172436.1 TrmH family RNA methyltransferase [Patescibacteria group bacterium]